MRVIIIIINTKYDIVPFTLVDYSTVIFRRTGVPVSLSPVVSFSRSLHAVSPDTSESRSAAECAETSPQTCAASQICGMYAHAYIIVQGSGSLVV